MIKIQFCLLIFAVLCLEVSYSYSNGFEYYNNTPYFENYELTDIIDELYIEDCSWQYIQNELSTQLKDKSIETIFIVRPDTVSLKYLSENIKNLKVIAITCPKTIIISNDFTSDLEVLSIMDDIHDVKDILPVLASYPKLKYLSFTYNINNDIVANLIDSLNANCKDIQELKISILKHVDLPNSIGKLSQLKYLTLYFENGTINSLEALPLLHNLKELSLRGITNITDVLSTEILSSMENLKKLWVDCRIMPYLSGLKNISKHIQIECQ